MRQTAFFKSFLQLFYTNTCYCCGQELIAQESFVCFSCLAQIPETHFHLFPASNEMYFRLAGRVDIALACSMFFFDKKGKLQALLEALKYKSDPQIGRYLGMLYGKILKEQIWIKDFDAMLAVPLHPRKKIQRGYNQSQEIVQGLRGELNLPLLSAKLRRTQYTISQTRKKGSSRWENVSHAFSAAGNLPTSVLLVDDVMTTGATLEACIRSMQRSNPQLLKVGVLTLAMTRKH